MNRAGWGDFSFRKNHADFYMTPGDILTLKKKKKKQHEIHLFWLVNLQFKAVGHTTKWTGQLLSFARSSCLLCEDLSFGGVPEIMFS